MVRRAAAADLLPYQADLFGGGARESRPPGERERRNGAKAQEVLRGAPPNPFESAQILRFQDFGYSENAERLSNVFDLWDCVPRYSFQAKRQEELRKKGELPPFLEIPFHHRGRRLRARIQPALIEGKDGVTRPYYASASEELIEHVLRKVAASSGKRRGYYDPANGHGGVRFSIHELRSELEAIKHGRPFAAIDHSLKIMSRSVVTISADDGKPGEFDCTGAYLNNLVRTTRKRLAEDPNAACEATFHALASREMDDVTYRSINYRRMMGHNSQLARWLDQLLCIKYTFVSPREAFVLHFSTVRRDSRLLDGYRNIRDAVQALEAALSELTISGDELPPPLLKSKPERTPNTGERGKILDVKYVLRGSREFIGEVVAASKRRTYAGAPARVRLS